jgi:hypothetical protein
MNDESGAWLTYAEAGERLGVSPEAARARAARRGWRRRLGNDGRAVVMLPQDERAPVDHVVTTRLPPVRNAVDPALVTALEAHIATLRGENETLRADLEAERARTSAAISAFADLAVWLDALAAERSRPWWRRLAG